MEFVEKSEEEITEHLSSIGRNARHEEAYVRLADGRCVHLTSTALGMRLTEEQRVMFVGADFNHNHPREPLNIYDLRTALQNRFRSISATTETEVYTAVMPKKRKVPTSEELDRMENDAVVKLDSWLKTLNSVEHGKALINAPLYEMEFFCKVIGAKLNIRKLK